MLNFSEILHHAKCKQSLPFNSMNKELKVTANVFLFQKIFSLVCVWIDNAEHRNTVVFYNLKKWIRAWLCSSKSRWVSTWYTHLKWVYLMPLCMPRKLLIPNWFTEWPYYRLTEKETLSFVNSKPESARRKSSQPSQNWTNCYIIGWKTSSILFIFTEFLYSGM